MVVSCEEVVNANDPQEAPAFILTARDTAVFPKLGDADSIFHTLLFGMVKLPEIEGLIVPGAETVADGIT